MQKKERKIALLSLINSRAIAKQSEIADLLSSDGFRVTQASVSRDIVELGIVKTNGIYSMPPPAPAATEFGSLTLATAGENLIIGRCASGLASAITVRIDAAKLPEIVGTIAGDDTIFIAVQNASEQKSAVGKIEKLFS